MHASVDTSRSRAMLECTDSFVVWPTGAGSIAMTHRVLALGSNSYPGGLAMRGTVCCAPVDASL